MKDTPKPRQIEIFRLLMTSGVPLDINLLKEKLQKSERTIRYDIQDLKRICQEYGIEIGYLTKKGYFIPAAQKPECSALLVQWDSGGKNSFVDDEEEKRFTSLFFYLFVQKGYVTAEKLAEVYLASKSTLTRGLGRLEEYFGNSFILEIRKAQGYRLKGDELTLRKKAVELLAARFQGSYTADDWFLLLPEELKSKISIQNIRDISRSIRQVNGKYNIWISNTAYLNLMSYCIARHVRLPVLESTGEKPEEQEAYASELLRELSAEEKTRETARELSWLQEVLRDYGISTEGYRVKDEILKRIMRRIMSYLENGEERESFELQSLRRDLEEHLKNYLTMSGSDRQEEENAYVLQEIQEYYYSYFQLAEKLAEIIEDEIGQKLGVMEICYLAVYLYKNGIQAESERKNVMVVCATGKGLSHFLTLRIKHVFPMLNVVGQVSPYQLLKASDLKGVDFAISTIPLENSVVPVVKISGVLLAEDIQRIQDFLKYGKLVDDIPMKQKNEASFQAKPDITVSAQLSQKNSGENLAEAAGTMSNLILALLEYVAKLPPQIRMSRDAMLGLVIHMSMAVKRWLSGEVTEDPTGEFNQEYYRVKKEYPDVFLIMEKFFEMAENTLQVRIPISERTAFFLYIIEEE
ncbi:PRD domain-containing protein [Laedolimicola intestinihominis]|uniref:PRD domain-containing protein n=1 Tax=Laedolimicola intestinihominis TaxID=3133166 RepID=A0ABV1FGJ8_9FIRM